MTINFRDFANRIKKIERKGVTRTIERTIAPSNMRESFYAPHAFTPGKIVTENDKRYEILDKRSNYLVCIDEHGSITKKFTSSLSEHTNGQMQYSDNTFKGVPIPESNDIRTLIDAYKSNTITDAYMVIKAINLFNEGAVDDLENLLLKSGIAPIVEEVKTEDQIKAVRIIAQAIGVVSKSNTADGILVDVLAALKTKNLSSEQKKVVTDMIDITSKKFGLRPNKIHESKHINSAIKHFTKTK